MVYAVMEMATCPVRAYCRNIDLAKLADPDQTAPTVAV